MQCEAKSGRNLPENAPAHTLTAGLCLFYSTHKGKKHHGLATTYSNMKMEKKGSKTIHLEGRGGSRDGDGEGVIQTWDRRKRKEERKERGFFGGGDRERGRMKERQKLTVASQKLQTDKHTGGSLLLEAMASNVITHVNRSHSLNRAITGLKSFHHKHTYCTFTNRKWHFAQTHTHTGAASRATDKNTHRHEHTWDRDTDTHSFRLTTTHQPPLLPAMCLRLPRSAPHTFRLMHSHPHRLPPHPNPQPLNHSNPRCLFCKENTNQNTSIREPLRGGASAPSTTVHRTTPRQQETGGKKKIQSGVDEEWGGGGRNNPKNKQCSSTVPSPFHLLLPSPVCLSSVQLWLCDAKLTRAKLSSIHTLAYNALPSHTHTHQRWAELQSLSRWLSPAVSRLAGTHMHPPTSPCSLPFSWLFTPILSSSHRSHRIPTTPLVSLLLSGHWCSYTHKRVRLLWLLNKFLVSHPWPTCDKEPFAANKDVELGGEMRAGHRGMDWSETEAA